MRKSKPRICFNVRRNGIPIRDHFLAGGIKAGISHNKSYAEAEACILAGLDYYQWRIDNYPLWLKSEVIAWHQMSGLIKAHVSSAEAKYLKRKDKKGKKGR